MYNKLKNIKITNEAEPRIQFSILDSCTSNNGVQEKVTREYDICLSLIPFNPESVLGLNTMEELLSGALKQIVETVESYK